MVHVELVARPRTRENRRVHTELPTGTVTFLFTDIEGSTRLLQELGDAYADVLDRHRRALREAWREHDGVEVDTQGDAFFVAFARATDAVAAASAAQLALADGPVRVRIGLHTGEPLLSSEGYVGFDVHRAARIAAAGHGGQVLLSRSTVDLAGVEVRDLGLHRLKDLGAPERIFQLGTEEFPPLKTLHETNLPIPATPFLGREREIDQIATLLRRPDVRLVTLTGPGGGGKTRLALQASASAADEYDSGVWWVPLASLTDPRLVATAAIQTLGSTDTLSAAIGDKRLLLVFDNFEHVLSAAADLAEALGSCAHLTVLVTSREPLHVDGEWEVAVDPLREHEAVQLFLQRAAAVRSDFAANGEVAEICQRLDCLPLAIELAAARVKALALPVLLQRLEQRLPLLAGGSRSAPERQRTLRATIAWSYELLKPCRTGGLHPTRGVRGGLHARCGGGGLPGRRGRDRLPGRQESSPSQRRALLGVADDSRVRTRAPRRGRRRRRRAPPACRPLPRTCRARIRGTIRPRGCLAADAGSRERQPARRARLSPRPCALAIPPARRCARTNSGTRHRSSPKVPKGSKTRSPPPLRTGRSRPVR